MKNVFFTNFEKHINSLKINKLSGISVQNTNLKMLVFYRFLN